MSRRPFSVSQSGSVTPQHLARWLGRRVIADAEATPTDIHGLRVSYATGVNFNSSNTDTPITLPIPAGITNYRVHGIRISGASAAINSATCGVFTQPGGTGIAVVASGTPVTVTQTGNDVNNNMQSLTIVNQDIIAFGDTTLYFRVQTPQGVAAKANVSIAYELLDISSQVSQIAPKPIPGPSLMTTSAGVFNSSNQLVRTLWSAQVTARASTPAAAAAAWDGTLDDGSVAPTGVYTIGLLTTNTTYTWEGVIGNTTFPHYDSNPGGTFQNSLRYIQGTTPIASMAIADSLDLYYCNVYHEKNSTVYFTTTSDLQHSWNPAFWPNFGLSTDTGSEPQWGTLGLFTQCCTDGTNIYFGVNNGTTGASNPVIGVVASTHLQIAFAAGDANHFIGKYTGTGNSFPAGIAAQHGGSGFIFYCRPLVNQLIVLKETDGSLAQTITAFPFPLGVACNPVDGTLWLNYQPAGHSAVDTTEKFTVNATTGAITTTGIQIVGPVPSSMGLTVSPDGTTLLLMDQNTQQIRAYNASNGTVKTAFGTSGVFGQLNGYATSPVVTDTKFMFNSPFSGLSSTLGGYVYFAPDGSWWLGDGGNYRNLHFSAGNSPTVIEHMDYLPTMYSCNLYRNDNTRVFANFLEFKIDYTLPLQPGNGSWKLVNNWSYGLTAVNFNDFNAMLSVGTYSNGRSYVILANSNTDQRDVWELTPSGLRNTGVSMNGSSNYIDSAFNIWSIDSNFGAPGGGSVYINPFTGFDVNNNPTWAGDPLQRGFNFPPVAPGWQTITTSQPAPAAAPDIEVFHPPVGALANNIYPVMKFRGVPANSTWTNTNHIGGIDATTGAWRFSIHPEGPPLIAGPSTVYLWYPEAPYVSTWGGPSSNYLSGVFYNQGGTDFFTSFRGELWGNGQTNMISHWHESGLLINRFGEVSPYFASSPVVVPNVNFVSGVPVSGLPNNTQALSGIGVPGRAGNAGPSGVAYMGNDAYVWHGEEWLHSGLHRWHIANMNSIKFNPTYATVNWNSGSYVPFQTPGDLLYGLPYNNGNLPNNTAGWTRSPTSNIGTFPTGPLGGGSPGYIVMTNGILNDTHVSPDITIDHNQFGVLPTPCNTQRTIPRTKTGNWSLEIGAQFSQAGGGTNANGNGWQASGTAIPSPLAGHTYNGMWLDVLDGSGNRIVSIFTGGYSNASRNIGFYSMYANEQPITPLGIFTGGPAGNDPFGHNWQAYTQGGWIYPGEPLYDGSQLKLCKHIVINASVGANTLTVSYGPDAITVTPYDPGADIVHPAAFSVNTKTDPSSGVINAGIAIFKLQFNE